MRLFKKIFTVFFISNISFSIYSEDILDTIRENVIEKTMRDYQELQNAGNLENSRVVYANQKSSDEEKEITKANNKIFQNYEKEIENAERAIRRDDIPDVMSYYTYTLKSEDISNGNGFNQIAAKLDQRQGTFATANAIESPESLKAGMTVILPIMQGLFIAENPENDFELLLKKEHEAEINSNKDSTSKKSSIRKVEIKGKKYNYLPGKSISPTAKAFFDSQGKDDKIILPLSKKILTSPFGYRTSPVSGTWKLHAGIDLAAPEGTDVFACKGGVVTEAQFNEVYGNYILIKHKNGKTSTYAHLSKINVQKNQSVKMGEVIGKVGTTGASTGPHLHFEIRENGKPTDPTKILK